jgi:hypothetical protein
MPLGPGKATNEPANYFAFGVQGNINEEATTFFYTKHLNGTGFDVATEFKAERVGGGGREVGLVYKNMVKSDGSLVTYAYPEAAGRLLSAALGKDTIATAFGSMGKHTIVSGSATTLPYLTVSQKWADEQEQATNVQLTELKIEGSQGLPIKMTAPFISGGSVTVQPASEGLAKREAGTPFMYPGASAVVEMNSSVLKATSSELTKFNMTIKNTLDETIQTLALNRTDVVWETADYNLDGTVKYTDKNFWNQVNYFGGTQVSISLATGNFHFYAAQPFSPTGSIHLQMPNVTFGSVKVNRLDPDGKTMFLDFTGLTTAQTATNSIIAEVVASATGVYTASNV